MKISTVYIGDSRIKPEEIKMKSRAIITNNQGKILIGNYGGVYLLPGGSIDDGENPNDTITRELKEETGFEFKKLEPFIKIKHYQNDYPKREGAIINRLIITYFYIGNERNAIRHENKLTEKEIKDGFELKYYDVEDIDKILEQDKTQNPRRKYFNQELRTIIDYYKREKIIPDFEI